MWEALDRALRRPALYQPSDCAFWEDEHISKGMLEAHLNPDWEAASRKHAFIDKSAVWIAGQAPADRYPRLLDLGCGPGLYTVRFAAMGYHTAGLDLSPRSIAWAKAHDGRTQYRCGNYLQWQEQDAYDLITLIYCDYGALSTENRAALLRATRRALRPGGRLVLDAFTPLEKANLDTTRRWEVCDGGFWDAGHHLVMSENLRYSDRVTAQHVVVVAQEQVRCYCIWDTTFEQQELQAELENAGFTRFIWADDVAGSPYTGRNNTLCVVAE